MITMDKTFRKLLEETAKGNFNVVNNLISNNKTILNSNTATSIVIECCRIFTLNNNTICIVEKDLLNLLITSRKYIEKLNEERSLSYIRSLFFIIKYFFEKGNTEIMLQMVPMILSDFIYYDNNQLKKVYSSIWLYFHTAISKMLAIREPQKNDDFYFEMCLSSVKINNVQSSNYILVANIAASYCQMAKCYESDPKRQYDFYKQLLSLLKLSNLQRNDEFYTATTRVIDVGTRNLFRHCNFKVIREYLEDYKFYIDEITNEKTYLEMGKVIHSTAQCVTELENESSSALFKKFESCLNNVKHYCTSFSKATQLPFVCKILRHIFEKLIEYHSKGSRSSWITCMEENVQVTIFKILCTLAQVFSKNKIKCEFCKGACDIDTNLFHSVTTMGLSASIMKISIANEMKVSVTISNQVLHYLERSCAQILIIKSKKCTSWLPAWSEIGIMIYNIAIKLHVMKHSETPKYFTLLIKNLLKLEGSNSEVFFKIDVLTNALKCLSDIHTEAYDYKRALMYVALIILLRPNSLTSSFKIWICLKAKEKQNEIDLSIQELTIACVLEENQAEIINIYPQARDHLCNSEQLLIYELSHYKKIWPSRIPMLAVFKKIYEKCSLVTTVKALVTTWGNNASSAHNGILEYITEITDKFETEIVSSDFQVENELYLALLYVLKYHALTTEARKKHLDHSNTPSENLQVPKNNKFDVSLCASLKLNEHSQIVEYLKKALILFDKCLSLSIEPKTIELLKECDVLSVVANIAFEFRLYCDSLQCVNAWFLCLKISRILENAEFILKSIGFVMEYSSMHANVINEFLIESEQLAEKLQAVNTNDVYETITTFYISKSIMYYNNQKFHCGFECYEKALCVFNNIPVDSQNEILKARIEFLHVQYLQLPCNLNIDNHETYSLQKFSQVCKKITSYMKELGYTSSYGLAVLFEINCKLIHMYKWMLLPREVRCYSRDLVVLAQQLVIPLRTAIIISYCAYTDLQSTRIDDCQVKIEGLSEILCLATNKYCTIKKNEIVCDKTRWKNNDVAELTDNFSEILLDCPVSSREQALQGSPTLSKSFMLPSILSHASECDCFYCLSVEYQNLLITVMHLDAEHYVLMNNSTAASYCFRTALQLYNRFSSKNKEFKVKVIKSISGYPYFDVKDMLHQSYCTVLLGYARYLFRQNDLITANRIFKDLINSVSENMYINLYLYNEAHFDYVVMLTKSIKVKEQQRDVTNNLVVVENTSNDIKTPESKQSKVVFYHSFSPNPESPPKRAIPKIKCDFSEVTEKKAANTAKHIKDKSVNFISGVVTPGCSNELYVPPLIHTVKKKLNSVTDVPVLEHAETNKNDTMIVPLSPNAYTPNALKASSGLQVRTKLLTKRLKSETAKKRVVEDDQGQLGNSSDCKNNVCKNLMSELCATDKKNVHKKREKKVNSLNKNEGAEQTKRVTRATARKRK